MRVRLEAEEEGRGLGGGGGGTVVFFCGVDSAAFSAWSVGIKEETRAGGGEIGRRIGYARGECIVSCGWAPGLVGC